MAKSKIILLDSDVISHFMSTAKIDVLPKILSPHHLFSYQPLYRFRTCQFLRQAVFTIDTPSSNVSTIWKTWAPITLKFVLSPVTENRHPPTQLTKS